MIEQLQLNTPKYTTIIQLQEMTDGNYCYVAYHPEISNCMSQGDTPKEAEENLTEATELVITHLISNDLPVPAPISWQSSIAPPQITLPILPADVSGFIVGHSGVYDSIEEMMTVPSVQM